MTDDDGSCRGGYIDGARTASLHDVGGTNLLAATLVGADYVCLAIVDTEQLGGDGAMFDPRCRSVEHEQIGPLPVEYVRRLTVSQRRNRPPDTEEPRGVER